MAVTNEQQEEYVLALTGLDDGPPVKRKTKGDHKRQARPIAPATVTVRDGEIVVVVPDVLGKNEAHKQPGFGRKGKVISKATQNYRTSVRSGISSWRVGKMLTLEHGQATRGVWRAEVLGVWPNKRGLIEGRPIDFEAPMGDADAPVSQAFDALKHAGIIDDDARIVDVRGFNLYRKGERWTVIRLVRVPDLAERDAAIAHLVAALPPPCAPSPVARIKRSR